MCLNALFAIIDEHTQLSQYYLNSSDDISRLLSSRGRKCNAVRFRFIFLLRNFPRVFFSPRFIIRCFFFPIPSSFDVGRIRLIGYSIARYPYNSVLKDSRRTEMAENDQLTIYKIYVFVFFQEKKIPIIDQRECRALVYRLRGIVGDHAT